MPQGPVVDATASQGSPRVASAVAGTTLFALAVTVMMSVFGTDLYLPAFPAMTRELATTTTGVQLSLTTFLVGTAAGQLVFGPWSDRVGRLRPLLAGVVLFLVSTVVAMFATSIEMLVVVRLLQGLGAAAGQVISRAIVLDHGRDQVAARALSLLMTIVGVSPVVALLVGGPLANLIGWRGLLAVNGGLSMVALVCTLLFVRESLPRDVRAARAQSGESRGAWKGLFTRGYLGYLTTGAFGFAIMLAYISASPFVYQQMIGLSPAAYGVAFAVNSAGIVTVIALSARLVRRYSVQAVTATGLTVILLAVLVILAFSLTDVPAWWLTVPIFFAVASVGFVLGNAPALALSEAPPAATGVGSAVLGVLQFTLAGLVAGLVGVAGKTSSLPLALTMLALTVVALLGLALGGRASARSKETHA